MGEVDGLRRLVHDNEAKRRQRVERAEFEARDDDKSQLGEHGRGQGLSITR